MSYLSSSRYTILFTVALSVICATILAILASALAKPQQVARELDRSKQMMMAARILNPEGFFQLQNDKGEWVPAKLAEKGALVPADSKITANQKELLEVYQTRFLPLLVDSNGKLSTFKEAGINEQSYLTENRKTGYYLLPEKLVYKILPNPGSKSDKAVGWVIPVNGYGLWDAIYGYLAIDPNGDTVIGISWYDQKETPGLGAVITESWWQKQFFGKQIFEPTPSGKTDFQTAPLGLTVVRGTVQNVYGDRPKAKTAVDGIPGATLTGNGVTSAYKDVLEPYRPFFISLNKENGNGKG